MVSVKNDDVIRLYYILNINIAKLIPNTVDVPGHHAHRVCIFRVSDRN